MSYQNQPPYGAPPQQPGYLPGRPPAGPRGAGLAWTSIVLAIVMLVLSPTAAALLPLLTMRMDMPIAAISVYTIIRSVVAGIVFLIGIVLSAIALRGDRRILAAIGLGAHGMSLASLVLSLTIMPLVQVLAR